MKDPQQELPLKHPHGDAKLANAKAALAESVRLIAEAEKHASEVAEELKHSREDSEEDKERNRLFSLVIDSLEKSFFKEVEILHPG